MEDVELDFARPRRLHHYQTSRGDVTFAPKNNGESRVIQVDVARYGKHLGNQQHEAAKDLSPYRVAYENLTFRRFRAYGDVPALTGRADASTSPHSIRGLTVEDMPPGLEV